MRSVSLRKKDLRAKTVLHEIDHRNLPYNCLLIITLNNIIIKYRWIMIYYTLTMIYHASYFFFFGRYCVICLTDLKLITHYTIKIANRYTIDE